MIRVKNVWVHKINKSRGAFAICLIMIPSQKRMGSPQPEILIYCCNFIYMWRATLYPCLDLNPRSDCRLESSASTVEIILFFNLLFFFRSSRLRASTSIPSGRIAIFRAPLLHDQAAAVISCRRPPVALSTRGFDGQRESTAGGASVGATCASAPELRHAGRGVGARRGAARRRRRRACRCW